VAMVEALLYLGQPLSASEMTKLLDDPELSVSRISYHLLSLAEDDVLTAVQAPGTKRSFVLT
jgi:DNA-binding transcriptional regulator GbsR (MarR family)